MNKKEYHAELAKQMAVLKERKDHSKEEINEIGKIIPINVMKDPTELTKYCLCNNLSLTDSFIILIWVVSQFSFLNEIKASNDVQYDKAVKYYQYAQANTIVLHRVNYILHVCMLKVYDTLEKDKRVRFGIKKTIGEAERQWNVYMVNRKEIMEETAFYTLDDYLRLTNDMVSPFLEKVYESIRDYMIQKGLRDVEVKARCSVSLLMAKVCQNSFRHFFYEFQKDSGVDYSECFSGAKMDTMIGFFNNLCALLSIKTERDAMGYLMIKDFNPENSQRFLWAWDDFIKILRDDELMDETAKKAIALNPDIEKEYLHVLNEENEKEVSAELEKLGEKYKVGSL